MRILGKCGPPGQVRKFPLFLPEWQGRCYHGASMKLRPLWFVIPAIALISGSCEKKPPASTESPATPAGEPAKPPVIPAPPAAEPVAPVVPALSVEERAAKFGIVKHLPKDTESFLSVYNGNGMSKRFKGTKVWELIEGVSGIAEVEGAEEGEPIGEEKPAGEKPADGPAKDASEAPEEASGVSSILGQEVFLATGKGTSAQTGNLLTVSHRANYFQMKLLTKAFLAAVESKAVDELADQASDVQMRSFIEVLKDPQSGMGLLEKMQMPPVYVGFKTLPESREQVAQQVASTVEYLGGAEDMVEPVDFERAGAKFSGYRLLGKVISKSIGQNREEMDEQIGAETADQLLATLAKKDLLVVSGTLGDYVILFIGTTPEDFQLVADAKDSLAATDALSFADAYGSKELAALVYGSDAMMDTLNSAAGGVGDFASGLRDGFAGNDALGDTRDIESLLQLVSEREQALAKLATSDTYGMVAFFEQGVKIESFGGSDMGSLDWKAPSTLAGLGKPDDVVLFANFTSDATYDAKLKSYMESLVETAYAVTKKVAESPIAGEEMDQFKDGLKMFDTKFRGDALMLLDALRGDFSAGLGQESALVVDLKGTVPAIPGIPPALVEKGKFIRASWISPVTDRSKLATSWDKMNEASTRILKTVSEMAGDEIPMQKPMSSEKNGFTTWFISMPFFNDDFVPSVTVSDKWFIASTSKIQALELADAAGKEPSSRTGFYLNVKIDPLRTFGNEWLKLVDENAPAVFADQEEQLVQFKEKKKDIGKAILALGELDSISAHVRRESGRVRGSVHFKTH